MSSATSLESLGLRVTYAGDAHVVGVALEQVRVRAFTKLVVVHVVVLYVPSLVVRARGCGRGSEEDSGGVAGERLEICRCIGG